jgi:threonyl-tRNA synthetase
VLGITDHRLRLSLHGPRGSYVDRPDMWRAGEHALRTALERAGVRWEEAPDEAAFYGPKIDVQVSDAGGREETLSTVQVDFHLPEVFDLEFQTAEGTRERPVLIHRSLISTMERLFAHLIERYAGAFPVWLAPVQLVILPVGEAHVAAAERLRAAAAHALLQTEILEPRASLGARIRRAEQRRVPFMAVIGDREEATGTVAVRRRDGAPVPPLTPDALVGALADLVARRATGLDLAVTR